MEKTTVCFFEDSGPYREVQVEVRKEHEKNINAILWKRDRLDGALHRLDAWRKKKQTRGGI